MKYENIEMNEKKIKVGKPTYGNNQIRTYTD
jgi:hypothetical protein